MGIFDSVVNFGSQMITNAQNERLMREAWGREDSAVQRRVADLKAAGLSPVLAAGQGASSMGPIRMEAPRVSGSLLDVAAQRQQIVAGEAGIARTRAETDLLGLQKRRQEVEIEGQEIANELARGVNPLRAEREGLDVAILRATKQSRIDQVLRAAEGAGLENTLKGLDAILKGMEIPERVLESVSRALSDQLKREQIEGVKAEIAVKAATVDMLAEREKAYTAAAERDKALGAEIKAGTGAKHWWRRVFGMDE